ncbi:MAG TPA: cardiolipin synthase [Syntrophomonas sp.]|nr:cardiolipin synthase [Syntrophomonas sp.]HRW12645.1 cardiolipin synthase [Syntrophomonas sp.]
MQRLIKSLFSRVFLFGLAIIIQLFVLILVIWRFSNYFVFFYAILAVASLIAVLVILNGRSNPTYKLAWIVPILVFPIFGGLFYLMFGGSKSSRRNKRKMLVIGLKMEDYLRQEPDVLRELEQDNPKAANQARYIDSYSFCPVYTHTTATYLTPGEIKFQRLLEELRKAERYIFLEYFIIEEGIMWNAVLEILVEKARQGVDVRVIYDDVGCLMKLPYGYDQKLERLGIKCSIFNPFRPLLSVRLNNRDHRKIAVIDGHTAFTGGINLADEYINAYERFGHWKDASIEIKGDAVWNFVVMFLSLWEWLRGGNEDYERFRPWREHTRNFASDGFVQPFSDSPFDDEALGESVYLNLINQAERYVYINTPYLILDNEMQTALRLAAKRGVDVRIVTPHIPDKWYVHAVTRSNYEILIETGVRIYEYTPGFMHSKTVVVDDQLAVVSTINLDYRSLFLHFECGVWLYKNNTIQEVREDFLQTLRVCQHITSEDCRHVKWYHRVIRSFLRMFAPLM